jgi:predicted nucleic acid-binding protein
MPSAYIETSVPSYYVARPSDNLLQASKQTSTRKWWDRGCSGLELYTSQETFEEASRGNSDMASARLELLQDIRLLEITEDVAALAASLVDVGIVPQHVASDALHIALAVHRMNYLVPWNFKHIANPFIRERIRKHLATNGFPMPVMCSPEELDQSHED